MRWNVCTLTVTLGSPTGMQRGVENADSGSKSRTCTAPRTRLPLRDVSLHFSTLACTDARPNSMNGGGLAAPRPPPSDNESDMGAQSSCTIQSETFTPTLLLSRIHPLLSPSPTPAPSPPCPLLASSACQALYWAHLTTDASPYRERVAATGCTSKKTEVLGTVGSTAASSPSGLATCHRAVISIHQKQ